MSQRVKSHIVERKCDGCGYVVEYDLASATDDIEEMTNWFAVGRKVMVDGRPTQLTAEAHTLECVPAAALKLATVQQTVDPPIDINSLRANSVLEN